MTEALVHQRLGKLSSVRVRVGTEFAEFYRGQLIFRIIIEYVSAAAFIARRRGCAAKEEKGDRCEQQHKHGFGLSRGCGRLSFRSEFFSWQKDLPCCWVQF